MRYLLATLICALSLIHPITVSAQWIVLDPVESNFKTVDRSLPAYEIDRIYVTFKSNPVDINYTLGSRFLIPTSAGTLDFTITRVSRHTPGTVSLIGRAEDGSFATMTITGERLSGKLHVEGSAQGPQDYHLRFDAEAGLNYVARVAQQEMGHLGCGNEHTNAFRLGLTPEEGGPDSGELPAGGSANAKSTVDLGSAGAFSSPSIQAMASVKEAHMTFDVMIPYTAAAKNWAETCTSGSGCLGTGNIESYLAEIINLNNLAMEYSELPITFRLVHAFQLEYDETADGLSLPGAGGTGQRLNLLTDTEDDKMREVHTLREQYGADIVAALFFINDVGGIGWVIGSPSGSPAYAFNINRIQQATSSFTVMHEIGHNIGNDHSRNQRSNAADVYGGMFPYSAGYRWMPADTGYTTIMGYSEGYREIPMFSSPDLQWRGSPAGVRDGEFGPTDARRSNNDVKLPVAFYLPTRFEPPVASWGDGSVSASGINLTLNAGERRTVTLPVANTGASDLMWFADIDLASNRIAVPKQAGRDRIEAMPIEDDAPLRSQGLSAGLRGGEASQSSATRAKAMEMTPVFEEGFEGFARTVYKGANGWRTNKTAYEFQITNRNASEGSQSMRLFSPTADNFMWVRSPYLGPMLTGHFEFSMDVRVNQDVTTQFFNRMDIYVFDGLTGDISSGVIFLDYNGSTKDGRVYTYDLDPEDPENAQFYSTQATVALDQYKELKIVYDATFNTIRYYYGGELISTNQYAFGTSPDYFYFYLGRGASSGTTYQFDNIRISRGPVLQWMDLPALAGSVAPGQTGGIEMAFDALEDGVYSTNLLVHDNLGGEPLQVPVTLNVGSVTSVGTEGELPAAVSLAQNYPNPFNPSTTISYVLREAGEVRLEVMDMLGRRVALLDQGFRASGRHDVGVNASTWASGVYVYRLTAGRETLTRQMMLVK